MLEPNGGLRVKCLSIFGRAAWPFRFHPNLEENHGCNGRRTLADCRAHCGILILVVPRLLNIIVAVYLIVEGLIGLNAVHHFIR